MVLLHELWAATGCEPQYALCLRRDYKKRFIVYSTNCNNVQSTLVLKNTFEIYHFPGLLFVASNVEWNSHQKRTCWITHETDNFYRLHVDHNMIRLSRCGRSYRIDGRHGVGKNLMVRCAASDFASWDSKSGVIWSPLPRMPKWCGKWWTFSVWLN